jgi:hypothetical protein
MSVMFAPLQTVRDKETGGPAGVFRHGGSAMRNQPADDRGSVRLGDMAARIPAPSPSVGSGSRHGSPAAGRNLPAKELEDSFSNTDRSWNFGEMPVFPREARQSHPPVFLQPKLAVGAVDDPLEREADAVADQVMRMEAPAPVLQASPLQLSRKCEACEEEDQEKLQKKSAGAAAPQTVPPIVHEVLRSPGQPLDGETRAFMEPRFGYDFSRVRVHTDSRAAASAASIGAAAYTAGQNIAFAGGQYDAASAPGRRLLAHELTHVVQQQPGRIFRQPPPTPAPAQPPAADTGPPGGDAGSPGGAPAPSPATPIKGTALANQLRSVSFAKASSPKVVRQRGSPGTIDLTQTDFLTFNAVARFAPSPALSAWTFGFFQLERPYEDYQVTLHESGATGPDKDIKLYLNDSIRAQLPLLDHTKGSVFFQPTGLPATAKADPKSGEVKLTYKDWPTTPFTTSLEKPAGTFYTLSGISARSFFFTAFGATDGTSTILLAKTFWDWGDATRSLLPTSAPRK